MRSNIRILAAVQALPSLPPISHAFTICRAASPEHDCSCPCVPLTVESPTWSSTVYTVAAAMFMFHDSDCRACLSSDCVHESPRSRCHSYTVPPRQPKRQRALIMTLSSQWRFCRQTLPGCPQPASALRQIAYPPRRTWLILLASSHMIRTVSKFAVPGSPGPHGQGRTRYHRPTPRS